MRGGRTFFLITLLAVSIHAGFLPAQAGTEPSGAKDLVEQGLSKYQKGDYQAAIALFTQALSLDPRSLEACIGRGHAEEAIRDFAAAEQDYTRALAIAPTYVAAHVNRGDVKLQAGNSGGAAQGYDHALALDAICEEGMARAARGDLKYAVADFDQAIADVKLAALKHAADGAGSKGGN